MQEKYPNGTIYVLPLGDFDEASSPSFEELVRYASIFLGCNVQKLAPVKLMIEDDEVYWKDQSTASEPGRKEHLSSR